MCMSDDLAAVYRTLDSWLAAFNAGDASALAALAADNAVFLPNDGSGLIGREAIKSHYQTWFEQFVPAETATGDEAEVIGDRAFFRGSYTATLTPKAGGEPVTLSGKWLSIYRRQADGSFKFTHLMWTSDKLFS